MGKLFLQLFTSIVGLIDLVRGVRLNPFDISCVIGSFVLVRDVVVMLDGSVAVWEP